jgi:hypothetical protein
MSKTKKRTSKPRQKSKSYQNKTKGGFSWFFSSNDKKFIQKKLEQHPDCNTLKKRLRTNRQFCKDYKKKLISLNNHVTRKINDKNNTTVQTQIEERSNIYIPLADKSGLWEEDSVSRWNRDNAKKQAERDYREEYINRATDTNYTPLRVDQKRR